MPLKAVVLKTRTKFLKPSPRKSPTGIKDFDDVLGGGFPRGSVILVSGQAGTGKTIFSFEWMFNGSKMYGENGLYLTFTEPLFKTLKNLESMTFYDRNLIEQEKIKILDIRKKLSKKSFIAKDVLSLIEAEVKNSGAQRLIIDSITAIAYTLDDKATIRRFIFDLGTMLATLGCTTILTSEVSKGKYSMFGVEEFISDGILLFQHEAQRFQTLRTLEIAKMRGSNFQTGSNSFKITADGIRIFSQVKIPLSYPAGNKKISIGIKGIDRMCNGGIFEGSTTLVAGSTGSGKSISSMHFIWEGLKNNEPCLYAGFEESRDQILRNAKAFGWDFEKYEKKGLLKLMCSYPTEKYIEEHLLDIKNAVDKFKVRRCTIDSLSAFKNSFDEEQFNYFAKRLHAFLKSKFITSHFTAATANLMTTEILSEAHLSTLTDNIILFKYVEVGGEMKLMTTVLKTRGDDHSKDLNQYTISSKGIVVGESFKGYESILSGSTRKVSSTIEDQLKETFTEFLGPIGLPELRELKEEGKIAEDNLLAFVDELTNEGSLRPEKGDLMRARLHTIFGTAADTTSTRTVVKSKKKTMLSRLFGGKKK